MTTCTRCTTELEAGDLRCPICALPVPPTTTDEKEERAQILRCDECGAAVAFDAAAQAPKCRFCAATMRVETPADPVESPSRALPFSIDDSVAKAAVHRWLASHKGLFQPGDLAERASVDQIAKVMWCAWVVDAEAHITWAADSDAGSWESAWAPHAGASDLSFTNLVVPASRGLTLDECRALTHRYNLTHSREIQRDDALFVEEFDMQRSSARALITEAIGATAASRIRVPGTEVRNLHTSTLIRSVRTRRFALPAFVVAYRYGSRVHRVVVHGQDEQTVLGTMPRSYGRVALGIAIVVAAFAILYALSR